MGGKKQERGCLRPRAGTPGARKATTATDLGAGNRMADDQEPHESSRLRSLISEFYPAPIARAFARATSDVEEAAPAVTDLVSVLIRYLALVSLRDLLARPADWAPDTPEALAALKRPLSDGKWLEILRHALKARPASIDAPPSASPAFEPDLAKSFLDLGLDTRLGELVSVRNKIVHDGARGLLPDLKRLLVSVLCDLSWLRFHRLLAPRTADGRGGAIARYRATLYRGHAMPYPAVTVETDVALDTGRMYLSRAGRGEVLALFPCVVEETCEACGGERDLFFLAQRERGSIRALSPVTGHGLAEPAARAAGQALGQLIDRVEKRSGRLSTHRFDVGGDTLVARRRLASGDVVGGRYRVERFIASGGMADVYEAREPTPGGRAVALKMLPIELARSEEALRRFYGEIKQAREVDHRNVVRYIDHGEDRGDQYLVLELATGWPLDGMVVGSSGGRAHDLAELLRGVARSPSGAPLPEPIVRAVGLDVSDGLHAIHEKGIVHRDLKPGNILLFDEGPTRRAKIADFGVSRERGGETVTLTGFTVGTPEYMAPEQVAGRAHGAQASPESDIYSLGVVLYEMLAGDVPFRGGTPLETAYLHAKRNPEWIARRAPAVSEGLARIVMKCLRKDPRTRYRTASDLYRDLRRVEEQPESDPVRETEPETTGLGPGFRLGSWELGQERTRDLDATLYAAVDEKTGEPVLVRVLGAALEGDAVARAQALARVRTLPRVRHPALLAFREVDEDHGYTYVVTDRPVGRPAVEVGPAPEKEAIRLVLELAAAVSALHEIGLHHGRIAPENVFVEDSARRSPAAAGAGTVAAPFDEPSRPRACLGPIALRAGRATGPDDVRGLGAVLFRLVAGRDPRSPDDAGAAGPDLAPIVARALSAGYASARAFAEDLAAVLRLGRLGRAARWARRHVAALTLVLAALLAAAGAAVYGVHRMGAEVVLETRPPGAAVIVDGAAVSGATPLALRMRPGVHDIRVELPRHRAAVRRVEIAWGRVKGDVSPVTLSPTFATCTFDSQPPGARVEVSAVGTGEVVATTTTPGTVELDEGVYVVSFGLEGFFTKTLDTPVEVHGGAERRRLSRTLASFRSRMEEYVQELAHERLPEPLKRPTFVECNGEGFVVYASGATAGGGPAVTPIPARDVKAAFSRLEELLAAGGELEATILGRLADGPLRTLLVSAYERRATHSLVLLVWPSGVEAYTGLFELLAFFNQAEESAGRGGVQLGFDPVPETEVEFERLMAVAVRSPLREPQPGKKVLIFECRAAAVIPVDLEALQAQVRSAAAEIESEPGFVPEEGFKRLAARRFEVAHYVAAVKLDPQTHLALEPKTGPHGTPEGRLDVPEEEFLTELERIDPEAGFAFFYVRPDSFVAFRKARSLVVRRGLEVGWQLLPADRPLGFVGSGGISLSPQR